MIAYSSPAGSPTPVLVVGAGPAGATAARRLALAGVRVRLLDRSVFPRNKPCGGGISLRVLKRFPYLTGPLDRIATHYLSRLYLEGPDGESALIESDEPAVLMVRRVEFDALLTSLAVEAGAELIGAVDIAQVTADEDRVTLTSRDGRRFNAAVVIAADGVHSVIARRLGLNKGWPSSSLALDMMEETPRSMLRDVDPSTLWVAYGYEPPGLSRGDIRNARPGYAYIFPKRDHVNIGIGYVLSHYRDEIAKPPYALQRDFVGYLRQRGIVEGDSARERFTPYFIPVGGPLEPPARGRVLLTGDAGGFVNAFTAEGIYYAMVSGELAARAVLEWGDRNGVRGAKNSAGGDKICGDTIRQIARCYGEKANYEIGLELRDSVILQRYLFADRRRIGRVVAGAHRELEMTRLLLDLAVGRLPYREVRRRMLARHPGLALQFLWARLRQSITIR